MQKVMIVIQDHSAVGRVYAQITEKLPSKDILIQAMKQVEDGPIYADEKCKKMIEDEYIEIFQERRTHKKNEDFVFLIHRSFANEHIVSAKIMK